MNHFNQENDRKVQSSLLIHWLANCWVEELEKISCSPCGAKYSSIAESDYSAPVSQTRYHCLSPSICEPLRYREIRVLRFLHSHLMMMLGIDLCRMPRNTVQKSHSVVEYGIGSLKNNTNMWLACSCCHRANPTSTNSTSFWNKVGRSSRWRCFLYPRVDQVNQVCPLTRYWNTIPSSIKRGIILAF